MRSTRTESPAAHNHSGMPIIARIAQIIATPSCVHRLSATEPLTRRAAISRFGTRPADHACRMRIAAPTREEHGPADPWNRASWPTTLRRRPRGCSHASFLSFSGCRAMSGHGSARDAIASVSIWALLVPQSLAYSSIAGVPVQFGLYTAFAALLGVRPVRDIEADGPGTERGSGGGGGGHHHAPRRCRRAGDGRRREVRGRSGARDRHRVRGARPGAHGLGLQLPVQGGDGRIRPRLLDRHHHRAVPQAARRAESRRKLHGAAVGHHQEPPRHEPDNPRARDRVSRDAAADAVPVPPTAARTHRRRALDPRGEAARPHGSRSRRNRSGARRSVLGRTARRRMGACGLAPARRPGGDLRRLFGVACLGALDGNEARLHDRSEPGADRARCGVHGRGVGRRIPDRRQSFEDLGGRCRRAADGDGVDPQRRACAADDAVPRLVVRGSAGRRARRDRHRCDDRSDQLR